ncbi:hypothetical protein BCR33DRAFT_853661 [Rhizoclosmatium globosum]|uniref:Ankyrin n=1 Tax=Rhizoclosmatium globosum TaxID=329046 RepID=A0A1Y2BWG1_9FUNG|nr:hypothetical protein BCR33DRAFT_853661 [Rhizoclosmatium globosum]|eukprot:ORY39102.1 hypothetical protein BCR33DRAFT_853661 [Rhizoclosmatium globosum]
MTKQTTSSSDNQLGGNAPTSTIHQFPLPTTFDPETLHHFHTTFSTLPDSESPPPESISSTETTVTPSYATAITFLTSSFGPEILARRDEMGFTILHYVAGMTRGEDEVNAVVDLVLELFLPTSKDDAHILMSVEALPPKRVAGFEREQEYLAQVVGMKGYTPLGVAARGANLCAIKVFIDRLNASPFAGKKHDYVCKNEIRLRSTSALQIAIDFGLGSSVYALLEAGFLKIKDGASKNTAFVAASRVLSPKMKLRKAWPELVVLGEEESKKEKEDAFVGLEWWDVRDEYGNTPLHSVCASKLSDEIALNLIQILLHHQANSVFVRDCAGRTLLTISVLSSRSPLFFQNLLNLPAFKANTPPLLLRIIRKLKPAVQFSTKVECRRVLMHLNDFEHGRTPVEWAEACGFEEVARILKEFL